MKEKQNVKQVFENPGAEWRGKPFWSWNGELEKDELVRQMHVIKEMGFGGFFMHSRSGLITEYLGDEWFELINAVTDASAELGLEPWLYDEDRWPSGSAGGKVTTDPQYRMKSLTVYCQDKAEFQKTNELPGDQDDELVAMFAAAVDGTALYEYEQCESKAALQEAAKKECYNKILVYRIVYQKPGSVYNGTTYIDTMSRKAVDKFIELTHEEYRKRCGSRIGTSIKGIFTDEPHRGTMLDDYHEENGVEVSSAAYTDDLFEEFEKRYGYDLKPMLPELFFRKDGRKIHKVKINFVDLCNLLFIERFAQPINEWCNEHNMIFTGHVLHEDSLTNQTVPNGSLMRFYEYMEYPGIDLLSEHNRCYWVAKQISSAARQLGKKRILSELYGCTGWQFDFKGHKAVGDWQALMGVNLRCPHLSWYTMEGAAKRDYPASILHQASYYKDYDYVESYFARFGVVMSQGNSMCDILVLNPIESDWALMHWNWARGISPIDPDAHALEAHYEKLFHMLMGSQLDFDYGEEYMMSRMYSITNENGCAVLHVGKASYHTVLVSGLLTMRPSTVKILREFMNAGGSVVFTDDIPAYIDGEASDEVLELSRHANAQTVAFDAAAIKAALLKNTVYDVEIVGEGSENIFVQLRGDAENKLLYIAMINVDRQNKLENMKLVLKKAGGTLKMEEGRLYAQEWELVSGSRYRKAVAFENGCPAVSFDIEAAGDKVFVFTLEDDCTLSEKQETALVAAHPIQSGTEFEYELDEQNVCVLDIAAWKCDGGEWQEPAEVLRVDSKLRDIFGIEHRSGEMLQPWYAKKYCNDAYAEVELEYEFYAEELPKGDVFLAGERPELFEYAVNGVKLENQDPKDFWIDICFKKMAVPAGTIVRGRNVVTLKTLFRRTTNIESVYLVGDFGVHVEGAKKTLVKMPEKLGIGRNLCEYDLPFYTGCVTYRLPNRVFDVGDKNNKTALEINGYCGSLAKVSPVGEKDAKIVAWAPYEADVTDWVRAGKDIAVTLVCSRKNLFGPLHELPVLNRDYSPLNFITSGEHWSDDYALLDSRIYGLTVTEKK